jgi:hypothetical protein
MMSEKPYFPPLYGDVACGQCEIKDECPSCGKYQRNRREFTFTSGRCPRLPDKRGFVEKDQRELYAATFPIIHAERGEEDAIYLTLMLPGQKRGRKVYCTKSGYWYFRDKDEDLGPVKRIVTIEGCWKPEDIIFTMDVAESDYCIFRCRLEEHFV